LIRKGISGFPSFIYIIIILLIAVAVLFLFYGIVNEDGFSILDGARDILKGGTPNFG